MTIAVSDLYQNPENRQHFVERVTKHGRVKNMELAMKKKNGEFLWGAATATVHYDEAGNVKWIDGLRSLLDTEAGIEVIGEAENGREALEKVQQLHPHIVLMDISMPDLNGLEATRQIKQQFPEVNVLILTMHADEEYVFQISRAGASGYVLKHAEPSELVMAIQATARGGFFLSPSISRTVIERYIQQLDDTRPISHFRILAQKRIPNARVRPDTGFFA